MHQEAPGQTPLAQGLTKVMGGPPIGVLGRMVLEMCKPATRKPWASPALSVYVSTWCLAAMPTAAAVSRCRGLGGLFAWAAGGGVWGITLYKNCC